MNPSYLDAAIGSNTFSLDMLQSALKAASPVEAMILLPLIKQYADIGNTLKSLKSAIREAADR